MKLLKNRNFGDLRAFPRKPQIKSMNNSQEKCNKSSS